MVHVYFTPLPVPFPVFFVMFPLIPGSGSNTLNCERPRKGDSFLYIPLPRGYHSLNNSACSEPHFQYGKLSHFFFVVLSYVIVIFILIIPSEWEGISRLGFETSQLEKKLIYVSHPLGIRLYLYRKRNAHYWLSLTD